jgi:hypothetical protein
LKFKLIPKNIPTFILLGISIFLIFCVYDLNEKFGVQKISEVNLNTKIFNVTGYIIAERRADYIFPTDTLRYQLVWVNKISDPLKITTHLEGTIGENNSFLHPKEFDLIIISQNNPLMTFQEFTLDKEGQHNIRYVIEIVNQTDGTNLKPYEIPDKIEILSRADQLQKESNWNSFLGLLLSTFIAGFALFFTGYQTLRSRYERNLTLRAWLGTSEAYVHVHGHFNAEDQFIPHEKWKKLSAEEKIAFDVKNTRRYIIIKNYGHLPALNVRVRAKNILGKSATRKDIESEPFTSSSVLMPDEPVKIFFTLTKEEELSIEDPTKDFFCIVDIEYDSPKNVKRKYGFIMSLSQQLYGTQESWIE